MNAIVALTGGTLLLPDGRFEEGTLIIEDGVIRDLGADVPRAAVEWDAAGRLVLPGMVDLHGDAFERQIMPRPGVQFPLQVALMETDRQLLANGITTAYHGVTYSWEPGLRGRENMLAILHTLQALDPLLSCDTRLHLRFEVYNLAAVAEVLSWLAEGKVDLLAFNDHLDTLQSRCQRPERLAEYAGRAGVAPAEFAALLREVESRAGEVPGAVEQLAAAGRTAGLPLVSHDDDSPETRQRYRDLGSRLCEFPVDEVTARAAIDAGDSVILGGPNVLRGGSHCGRLAVASAARDGLCDILTSDYYYPSMLQAVFMLAASGVLPLPKGWDMVARAPAKAAGLADRGSLEPGLRADLVMVETTGQMPARVCAGFVAGRPVYSTERFVPLAA